MLGIIFERIQEKWTIYSRIKRYVLQIEKLGETNRSKDEHYTIFALQSQSIHHLIIDFFGKNLSDKAQAFLWNEFS